MTGTPAPGWTVSSARSIGAYHVSTGLPVQDSVAVLPDALVAAVADGHGHSRHFRSARGSSLAVEVGSAALVAALPALTAAATAADAQTVMERTVAPALVDGWRDGVFADLVADPVPEPELERNKVTAEQHTADPTLAYGSTCLLAGVAGHWLVLLQLGDGDVVVVTPQGTSPAPLPVDPLLDGHRTTSLCQPDALDVVRCAVVDLRTQPALAVFLASDGYGNAQASDPWEPGFARDLAGLLHQNGSSWVYEQLPGWVERCASAAGSGDDTTAALLVQEALVGAALPATGPVTAPGESQQATVVVGAARPAAPEVVEVAATAPAPVAAASVPVASAVVTPDPAAARARRSWLPLVGGAVVVVAAVVGAVLLLGGGSGSGTNTPTPSPIIVNSTPAAAPTSVAPTAVRTTTAPTSAPATTAPATRTASPDPVCLGGCPTTQTPARHRLTVVVVPAPEKL